MNIREAARTSGLSADTIRFYERKGVLPRPPRRENGYRSYTAEHVRTLRLARGLRDFGLPLAEVGAILPVAHDGTCDDLRETLTRTLPDALTAIEGRIRELRRTSDHLTSILDGLREMQPRDSRVPGMEPCGCVELVSADEP